MKLRILGALLLFVQVAASQPTFVAQEMLGRPTDHSVTVNAAADRDLDVYFEYGLTPGAYTGGTPDVRFPGGAPFEVVLDRLEPGKCYYYRMRYREPGAAAFSAREERTFQTQRPRGSSFTFAVQFDPHMDDNSDPETYRLTLQNELSESPDFLIDLGDTFMSDKLGQSPTYDQVLGRHLLLRSYYDLVCHSTPLFLTLGNHEGEWGSRVGGAGQSLPVMATRIRKLYYPNPVPDGFYTGSTGEEQYVGLRENYYAWEWGDALFVVLDPYWYTPVAPEASGDWSLTLGRSQYEWLKKTLESSTAAFKFVFCHNLVGGKDMDGKMRGGVEVAKYLEWGGYNLDDTWGFDKARPGWAKPIHQLLVANNVTAFFHGHDHLYAKQDLDGVVYQEGPQPGARNYELGNRAVAYNYAHGTVLGGSGYLRVEVSPAQVKVDFVRTWLPKDETQQRHNGEVADSYTIKATRKTVTAVSAGSYVRTAAPESIAASFGEALTSGNSPLSVCVQDSNGVERNAEVLFASPAQVNFVVPAGTAPGVATVKISSAGSGVATGELLIDTLAPALFSANASGAGVAAATVLYVREGSQTTVLTFDCSAGAGRCIAVPISLGSQKGEAYLSLYGTGIRNHSGLSAVNVWVGGEEAEVLYAGPQGQYAGLDQVNVRIPETLAGRGDVTVALATEGKAANAVTINIID